MSRPFAYERLRQFWRQISTILAEIQPEFLEDLNKGASGSQIALVEKKIGKSLPEDLAELYRLNNGQGKLEKSFVVDMFNGGIFEGYYFMPLEGEKGVLSIWQQLGKTLSPPHPEWLPFGQDGSGNYLCIDLDPITAGRVLELNGKNGKMSLLAETLTEYLEQLTRQIIALHSKRIGAQRKPK